MHFKAPVARAEYKQAFRCHMPPPFQSLEKWPTPLSSTDTTTDTRAAFPRNHLPNEKEAKGKQLTWERVHGDGDAELVVPGHDAKDGRVDLVHVQRDAVQRAVVRLVCDNRWDEGRGLGYR